MNLPIKPENSRWTDGQWQAIYEAGHPILVSASAGSGKTTVLVQRVIEKIKAGDNVDELLIVTYTEAAAKEMKLRIQTAIQQAITSEGEAEMKRHLVKQVSLLANANISTLHAFCLQVIRRYYYLIEMDPVFRLLTDETEMLLLKEDVWQDVRENLYGAENPAFYQLTASFSGDRSDEGLTKLIFSLYDFARANPDPTEWLTHLSDFYNISEDTLIGDTRLYQELLRPQLQMNLEAMLEKAKEAMVLSEQDEALAKQKVIIANEYAQLQGMLEAILANQFDQVTEQVQQMSFERYPTVKKDTDEAIKEVNTMIKSYRDAYKKSLEKMKEQYFYTAPAKMKAMMNQVVPLIHEMAQVTLQFSEAYWKEKQERGVLDFNDLEHLTLQILAIKEANTWSPTEASLHYRAKFKEVLVDEYQDINQLQENIVKWLAADEQTEAGNLFMVGDVKQSIYSFRLADPSLFLGKYERYEHHDGGERIVLAENFRSRGEVLFFTNLIFEQLMDTSVGQMVYEDAAKLIDGFPHFPQSDRHQPELLIYETGMDEKYLSEEQEVEGLEWDMQVDDKTDGELRMVALKIKELITQQFPIYDKKTGQTRPIRYQDIVLLTPTKKNNLVLLDRFKQMEIPLQINDTQNYFQTTEIKIMMALLQIIDNPFQDIPLAAVLRSPIVGLDENEMAFIRISKKTGNYYQALLYFYENYQGEALAGEYATTVYQKIHLFMQRLSHWRETARRKKIVDLIWTIYQETGFLDYVGGMSAGKQRQANLHALYDRASSYEKTSFRGLFQFVRFIEKMQEKNKDLAEPQSLAADEDAVRVMTIHASKGLEFPVVFILDMTKGFNLTDVRERYVFDDKYGVGLPYIDLINRLTYPTLVETALKTMKKNKLLSEEMRKLYVALTRAEEKLFIVGSYKNAEAAWKEWSEQQYHEQLVLPGEARLSAKHMMKWIGMTLIRHPQIDSFAPEGFTQLPALKNHPAQFSISFYDTEALKDSFVTAQPQVLDLEWLKQVQSLKPIAIKEEQQSLSMAEVTRLMNYQYTHQNATRTTSYQSVSEIKRLFEEPEDTRMVKIDINEPRNQNRYVQDTLNRPKFLQEVLPPTGAEIGSATHLVMQEMDLTQAISVTSVQAQIAQLVSKNILLENVAKQIDPQQIVAFFQTELGQLLCKYPTAVKREMPFSLLMGAGEIFTDIGEDGTDKILVHGIIDGYLALEDELILFDFKTDYVPQGNEEAKQKIVQKYKGQLHLYQRALSQALDREVTASYLYLFALNETILIE